MQYDKFHSLSGEIQVGETVVCKDRFGELKERKGDSITICLHPSEYEVTYKFSATARMRRFEPKLDYNERKPRKDQTPQEWIDRIDAFRRKHNHISPNRKDIDVRCDHRFPKKKQTAPQMYQYKPWNELWKAFQMEVPGIAAKIINPKQPHECPMLLRTHAPWEMTKGSDSSCLCINCEGTNAVRRGSKAAVNIIEKLL